MGTGTPQLEMWESLVNLALRDSQSLRVFCKERVQYSRYEAMQGVGNGSHNSSQ
jgi:hypothetical protein